MTKALLLGITIGVIGSFVWEYIVRPTIGYSYPYMYYFFISKEGYLGKIIGGMIVKEVASLGYKNVPSIILLNMFFTLLLILIILAIKDRMVKFFEKSSTIINRETTTRRWYYFVYRHDIWFPWYLGIVIISIIYQILFSIAPLGTSATVNACFEQRLSALSAYLDDNKIKKFKSRWALMSNIGDYRSVNKDIEDSAKAAGVVIPECSINL